MRTADATCRYADTSIGPQMVEVRLLRPGTRSELEESLLELAGVFAERDRLDESFDFVLDVRAHQNISFGLVYAALGFFVSVEPISRRLMKHATIVCSTPTAQVLHHVFSYVRAPRRPTTISDGETVNTYSAEMGNLPPG